jgi:hypothetical protein
LVVGATLIPRSVQAVNKKVQAKAWKIEKEPQSAGLKEKAKSHRAHKHEKSCT